VSLVAVVINRRKHASAIAKSALRSTILQNFTYIEAGLQAGQGADNIFHEKFFGGNFEGMLSEPTLPVSAV
jgi:hypothetical protein